MAKDRDKLETATRAVTGENALFTRTRYQNGSLRVKKRGNGLKIWEFRYYEPLPEGSGRGLRAVTVGTLQDYPTEAAARRSDAAQAIILRINAEHTLGPVTASRVCTERFGRRREVLGAGRPRAAAGWRRIIRRSRSKATTK